MIAARVILATAGSIAGLAAVTPVLLLGLPLWAVALLTRTARQIFARFETPAAPWHELIDFDPVIGWRSRPNLAAEAVGDAGVFRLTTGPDGWRGARRLEDSEIVVFGDSFAFGYDCDDEAFFAHVVRGPQVKAIGAPGYNLAQEFLLMRQLAGQFRNKLVVWLIFYGNDLYENLTPMSLAGYRMPFVRARDGGDSWEIVSQHLRREPWPFSFRLSDSTMAEMCCRTFRSQRAYAACEYLLSCGKVVCDRAGGALAVIGIPDPRQIGEVGRAMLSSRAPDPASFDAELPDKRLGEICRALHVPFVPLMRHLTLDDYLHTGCHWNSNGHRRVAQVLEELHQRVRAQSAQAPSADRVSAAAVR